MNSQNGILLLGGGGHCKSVLCALLGMNAYERIGIIDDNVGSVLGVPVLGKDKDIPSLHENGYDYGFVAVGSIGDTTMRRRLFALLKENKLQIINIVDPSAVISPFAKLGNGIFIGKNAAVNADAVIGDGAILNTGCIVEHDDQIGAFVHIASGAVLGGGVHIGNDTHVGSNATVLQGVSIGERAIIGAGSVVTRNMPGDVLAYGNPCKRKEPR